MTSAVFWDMTMLCSEEVSEDLQKTVPPTTGEDDGGSRFIELKFTSNQSVFQHIQKRVVIIITAMGTSNLT
jgi:hypothetical protein